MSNQESLNRFVIGVSVRDDGNDLRKLERSLEKLSKYSSLVQKQQKGNAQGNASAKKRNDLYREFNSVLGESSVKLNHFNKEFVNAARSSKNEMGDMLRRVTLWSSGIAILFGSLNQVKQVFQATKELEMSMAELQKVMSNKTPFREVQRNLFAAGKAYSLNVQEVSEVAKIWAQQGKDYVEVAHLTETALLGVNSANLKAAESVEFLTSVTKSYNIEAERTQAVMDGIMKVQASFAITAQDLSKAFMRTGATAKVMGDDLGTVFGAITAIGEITREKGNVVGQSLKTQFARLNRPETMKGLEAYGIYSMDAQGRRANTRQIFQQISDKIQSGELSPEEQIAISLKIGGIRKFKDALILMNQWHTAMAARMKYLKAYGDAEKASAITQDTLTKRLEKLGVVFTELGVNVLETSLIPSLKESTTLLTGFVGVLNKVVESDIGKEVASAVPFTVASLAGGYGARKLRQGRLTDMFTDLQMGFAMRGVPSTSPDAYSKTQKLFGFHLQDATDSSKRFSHQIKSVTANLQKYEKLAMEGNQHAQMMYRSQLSNLALLNAQQAGLLGGRFRGAKMFFRGMKSSFMDGNIFQRVAGRVSGKDGGMSVLKMASSGLGFGSLLKTLTSTTIVVGALTLAFKGLTWVYEEFRDKSIELEDQINVSNNEAAKAYLNLATRLDSAKDSAKSLGMTVSDYITSSFSNAELDRTLLSKLVLPVGEQLDPEKGSIDSLKQLEGAINNVGIAVKNTTDALDVQMTVYKYITHGILKQQKELKDEWFKAKEDIVDDVDLSQRLDFIKTGLAAVLNPKAFPVSPLPSSIEEEYDDMGVYKTFAQSLSDRAKVDVEFKRDLNNILKSSNILVKDATTGMIRRNVEIGELLRALYEYERPMPEMVSEDTNRFKYRDFARGNLREFFKSAIMDEFGIANPEAAGISRIGGAEEAISQEDWERKIKLEEFDLAVNELSDEIFATDAEFQNWQKLSSYWGRELEDKMDGFSLAISANTSAFLEMQDYVYNAASGFVRSLEDIDIAKKMNEIFGTGFSPGQMRFDAFKDFSKNLLGIVPDLDKKIREAEHRYEMLGEIITGDEYSHLAGIKEIRESLRAYGINFKDGIEESAEIVNDVITKQKTATGDEAYHKVIKKPLENAMQAQKELDLAMGNILKNMKTDSELGKKLSEMGFDFSDVFENQIKSLRNMVKSGEFDDVMKKIARELSEKALEEVKKINKVSAISQFAQKFVGVVNDIEKAFLYGADEITIKKSHDLYMKMIKDQYAIQIAEQRKLLSMDTGENENEIKARIHQLELQRDTELALSDVNYELEKLQPELEKMISAFDNLKSSTVSFFSESENFKFKNESQFESAFTNYLNNISAPTLENNISEMFDSLVGDKGLGIGSFLLGKNKPMSPDKILEKATDLNTTATAQLTITMQELNQTAKQVLSSWSSGDLFGDVEYGVDGQPFTGGRANEPTIATDSVSSKWSKITQGLTQLSSFIMANKIADNNSRTGKYVMIGASLGQMAGKQAGTFLSRVGSKAAAGGQTGSAAGPWGAVIGTVVGAIAGSLMERRKEGQEQTKHLQRIVENTASLKDIDSKIFNAPADFRIPAVAKTGGNVQYMISGVTINVNGSTNPQSTAKAIRDELTGISNFNSVGGGV